MTEDRFFLLGHAGQFRLPNWPMPKLMSNHGNYIVSMANVCRWMAGIAEELGVEIFPGMAASALVTGEGGEVRGVVAGEFGLDKERRPGPNYEPGMELRASTCSSPRASAARSPSRSSPATASRTAASRRSMASE